MPEPTNAARELAATGTPGPWEVGVGEGDLAEEFPIWMPSVGHDGALVETEEDAFKITRSVNALGPLGDLVGAFLDEAEWRAEHIPKQYRATGHAKAIRAARDAVEAALRGEQS